MTLSLESVAGWVTQRFWRKTDRIVAKAGIVYGTDTDVLDRYDEGTWVAALTASVTNPDSVTYTNADGKYTRIGNVVFYSGRIQIDTFTLGSGAGLARFSLPFVVTTTNLGEGRGVVAPSGPDLIAGTVALAFRPVLNSAYGNILQIRDNAVLVSMDIGALAAGNLIRYSGFYFTR